MTLETSPLPALAGTPAEANAAPGDSASLCPATDTPPRDILSVPVNPAAESLAAVGKFYARDLTAADMARALEASLESGNDGEIALHHQAEVLDSLFHRLLAQSLKVKSLNGDEIPGYINEDRLVLALRTQNLCRRALTARRFLRLTTPPPAKK